VWKVKHARITQQGFAPMIKPGGPRAAGPPAGWRDVYKRVSRIVRSCGNNLFDCKAHLRRECPRLCPQCGVSTTQHRRGKDGFLRPPGHSYAPIKHVNCACNYSCALIWPLGPTRPQRLRHAVMYSTERVFPRASMRASVPPSQPYVPNDILTLRNL